MDHAQGNSTTGRGTVAHSYQVDCVYLLYTSALLVFKERSRRQCTGAEGVCLR